MAQARGQRFLAVVSLGFAAVWLGATPLRARADRIVLRGGGQIRGKIVPDPKRPGRLTVLTERGKTPLSFEKPQVVQVIAEPSALDDYLARRDATTATAEGQYDLGLWCEQHKLTDLASLHYEEALKHDKSFAPAHRKLGHVKQGDLWLGGDALREAQGLVRHKGKWVTRDEKALREQETATAAEQASWVKRIRLLRDAVQYGAEVRRREAESQLLDIRDPAAVAPLVRVLGVDADPMRTLLARVLGLIPGPEAASALVARLLSEGDPEVRLAIMGELEARKGPEISRQLVRALRSGAPEVINRAAWGLASLNAVTTVPSLVGVLVTTKQQVMMAPSAAGPSEPGAISSTFGSVPPSSVGGSTPIAFNGSSVAYMTGPVVGPGVVAYGAYAAPYYTTSGNPSLAGTGVSAGGGLNGSRGPTPRVVTVQVHNTEVRSALFKLTGRDFGYDVDAWRRWVRTSFQPDPTPARRVPQP